MELLNDFFRDFSNLLWGWPMIILLLGTHIYLTIILRFPQRKIFTAIRLSFKKDLDGQGDVSQFASLATALAATIGTGNIVGVATAVTLGGPGAVLWCWLTGVFGISTKYAEGLLAVKYRQVTPQGKMIGGPMYALEKGLRMRWLAVLFAVFTAFASFGIGSTVGSGCLRRRQEHCPRLWHARTLYGTGLCLGVYIYNRCQCPICMASRQADCRSGLHP